MSDPFHLLLPLGFACRLPCLLSLTICFVFSLFGDDRLLPDLGRALSNTAIQTATPDNLLGRVLSLFFMDRGLWSLGSMLIGASGAVIGMDWTFALCGAVCAITAID